MSSTVVLTLNNNRDRSAVDTESVELRWVIVALWTLCLVTFSLPNRVSPESAEAVDLVATAKLLVRVGVIGTGLLLISRTVSELVSRPELRCYKSLFPFLLWSGLTIVWSPLRTISMGQYLGLIALAIYSALVSMVCRDCRNYQRILSHLLAALFLCSLATLVVYSIDPHASGLVRAALLARELGMVHPTAAGATASLGLVLITYQQLSSFDRRGSIKFLMHAIPHSVILILANSRSAIGMTVIAVAFMLIFLGTARLQSTVLLVTSVALIFYILIDPGFELVAATFNLGSEFVSRGQSAAQISSGSGRFELWSEILRQFEGALLLGHGYFMTSSTGYLDVWTGIEVRDAHNVWLQILVTTGVIGFILFLIGGINLMKPISRLRNGDRVDSQRFGLAAIIGVWFFGWGMGCSTFMSAIRPESVVFTTILGMSIGAVYSQERRLTRDSALPGGGKA